ncbi:hypothetical protein MHYP_G00322750 [Metynnis hypsauchen]
MSRRCEAAAAKRPQKESRLGGDTDGRHGNDPVNDGSSRLGLPCAAAARLSPRHAAEKKDAQTGVNGGSLTSPFSIRSTMLPNSVSSSESDIFRSRSMETER